MASDDWLRAVLHETEIRAAVGVPGDGDLTVDGIAPLGTGHDRCLYFVQGEPADEVVAWLAGIRDCIVLTPRSLGWDVALDGCRVIEVDRPRAAMAKVLEFVRAQQRQPPWVTGRHIAADATVSPLASVEGDVHIGAGAVIEPFCTLGPDVAIGPGVRVRSGARINPRVSVGARSVIGNNAVLGSDGYGFERDDAGDKTRIPHLGGIVIGSDVDIGALSVVQSGTIAPTVIEDFVKIDDNVELGHNVRVGRNTSIVGGVVIGGSAVIGADTWIGINSSIRNGGRVGGRVLVGMDCSVQEDLADGVVVRSLQPDVRKREPGDEEIIGFGPRVRPFDD